MSDPKVTLIVGPRERFSGTQATLESLYTDTEYPFELVFVDVCSPAPVQAYLQAKAAETGFKILKTSHYISPNQARNVGLRYVLDHCDSDYIVFIENDVVVQRGWLTQLVAAAAETGAAIVGPLTCIGQPAHQVIHNAGGKSYIQVDTKNGQPRRRIRQSAYLTGRAIAAVPDQLHRVRCDYVEFHCMLVRRSVFAQTGLLDEGMLATREHIDFCFMVTQAGGDIYCDRTAVVTTDTIGVASNKTGIVEWFGQVQLPQFHWSDLPYFMLRWNDQWDRASLDHLRQKWQLTEDKYFQKRYAWLGRRRHELLIQPLVQRLTWGRGSRWLENALIAVERRMNRWWFRQYTQRLKRSEEIIS